MVRQVIFRSLLTLLSLYLYITSYYFIGKLLYLQDRMEQNMDWIIYWFISINIIDIVITPFYADNI